MAVRRERAGWTREPGPVGSIQRHRPFRRLVEAQALHAAGDVLVAVALANTVFFAVPLGEARGRVALYLALTMAPFAVLSPLIGPWLDRRPGSYRVAIVASMVGRAALAILLSSRIEQVLLYPLAFGLLVLSRVHGVSRSAVVPDTLPPGRSLLWANAVLSVSSVLGGALGAGPALGLNRFAGTDATLWAAAVVFATGALVATGLPLGQSDQPGRRRAQARAAKRLPPIPVRVQAAGVAMAALRAAVGFVTFLLAFLLRAEGEGAAALAVVVVAAGAGGLGGSVFAASLRVVLRASRLLLVCLVLVAVASVWASLNFGVAGAAAVATVVGFAAGVGRLAFDGLLQSDAPDRVRARTFARYETLFQLCWVLAGAVATAVPYRPRGGLWSLALLCLAGVALSVWRGRLGERGFPVREAAQRLAALAGSLRLPRRERPPQPGGEAVPVASAGAGDHTPGHRAGPDPDQEWDHRQDPEDDHGREDGDDDGYDTGYDEDAGYDDGSEGGSEDDEDLAEDLADHEEPDHRGEPGRGGGVDRGEGAGPRRPR